MRLGFDLDEVIAKTSTMCVEYLNQEFDCNFGIEVFEQYEFDGNQYSDDFEKQKLAVDALEYAIMDVKLMGTMKPYTGAVKALNYLKRKGHKIFIITKRDAYLTGTTRQWLQDHGIPFDKLVLTDRADKGDIARELKLDFFVDDVESNLYELYKAQARWKKGLALMTRPWNENEYIDTTKFTRVSDWNDILKLISQGNRLK